MPAACSCSTPTLARNRECRFDSSPALAGAPIVHPANEIPTPMLPDLTERLDRLLPQTQCGQCGYSGCRPYAEAMAAGAAGIARPPPGGDSGARALARLLGVAPRGYDRTRGEHKPSQVALVVEAD